eukprot:Blabericola_migrator_1__2817@NODE_1805_length_3768_cov_171_635774_g1162_i0_p2_GENE_NODE_1805_length_3768_cov_171_635774_g1162_i0NODE_1805_length_3768_cov_171_635774_g1162_i0_p2_ORF_typecomplete_len303_score59_65_NODE_1805_length_3768_cov_171_635774_g1162_i010711979
MNPYSTAGSSNIYDTPQGMGSSVDENGMKTRYQAVPYKQKKYVEKTVIQKEIVNVPVVKHNFIPQDKIVNRPVFNVVQKTIEQPHIVHKHVEVPNIRYVDIPKYHDIVIPRMEVKVVHEEIQIPGEIFHVAKPVVKEVEQKVTQYMDTPAPFVADTKVMPEIVESSQYKQVHKTKRYIPKVYPLEVHLPVPVYRDMVMTGSTSEEVPRVLSPAEFNSMLKQKNPNVPDEHLLNLYQRNPDGSIPTLNGNLPPIAPPPPLTGVFEEMKAQEAARQAAMNQAATRQSSMPARQPSAPQIYNPNF